MLGVCILWMDGSKAQSLVDLVRCAAREYESIYALTPTMVHVHPLMMIRDGHCPERVVWRQGEIVIVPVKHLQPHCVEIGIGDGTDGN